MHRIEPTPEEHERLREYVREKLRASGIIDEYNCNPVNPDSLAANIVHDAWRQHDVYYYADYYIELAIKYPPPAIDRKHFSLKDFVKEKSSQ